jgi:hypothetical protein
MRSALLLLAAMLFILPSLALETLVSDHFSIEYSISPEKDCYEIGEKIQAELTIMPKSSAYRVLIGGAEGNPRTYYFSTDLSDASWRLIIDYYQGGIWDEAASGKKVSIDVKYFKIGDEEKGIAEIVANLTAVVPYCGERICNISLISPSCEECSPNALPAKFIKVVNVDIFKNDIKSLRARMLSTAEKLKAENLYSEDDFRNVSSMIDSAESLLVAKKYIEAENKLNQANSALTQLADLTNRKLAEKAYSEADSAVNDLQKLLLNASVLLDKLRNHQSYSEFKLNYSDLEGKLNDLKTALRDSDALIKAGRYSEAIEKLGKVKEDANSTSAKANELIGIMKLESEKGWLPSLPVNPLYIVAAVAAAVAAILLLRFRRRRRWDELR